MTNNLFEDTEEADTEVADTSTLHTIGQGFCGTVWAAETGPAFKREDGGPDRSLINDFEMHHRVIQSLQKITTLQLKIQIPACYSFIKATDQQWWSANHQEFPQGCTTPCNMIQSQRIPPFSDTTRRLLIKKYCPPKFVQEIIASKPNKDCLVRPYLGRRRTENPHTTSRFTAFSLRNFPLHIDQLEELGITTNDIYQYARVMAETLAMMHWVGEVDGNDIEFVLAPPCKGSPFKMESNILGDHSMWVLDFDLCRRMTMDPKGVEQAAAAFWSNDRYYPRPGLERDLSLWIVFREHYIQMSETCIEIVNESDEAERRRALSRQFIHLVEQEGNMRKTMKETQKESDIN
ncbi:Protein of unknown function DUF3669, zinc finger protein [Penicillium expansum]|uniref:DUF3669 domain-containing protein n=1 Tax=Penicillium expansum TaxID=27334 RepID=A0A0A2JMF1_PENEN|nr:Protein of unknown function DUF3669, zinc finger protein [Penicillium expansum]KGO43443.1 Protein of unknown function DUF3669, zinc finger protein [Penicillium expansum]KGO45209.1 Protein of unknown function DUF3669, zinc finger protein [Penicillium expansum]KGO56582.1 Protein of unknown function DUF3669, zinc finger protein [Penicillium expansum]